MAHALVTGDAVNREFTLSDGTVVDCAPAVVYLDTPEQVGELAEKIGRYVEATVDGHVYEHTDVAAAIHEATAAAENQEA